MVKVRSKSHGERFQDDCRKIGDGDIVRVRRTGTQVCGGTSNWTESEK
ncbi:MAG: hypothetical protein ABSA72_01050 [Nitrososphaerales archaeon]